MSYLEFEFDIKSLQDKLELLEDALDSENAMRSAQSYMLELYTRHIAQLALTRSSNSSSNSKHYDVDKIYADEVTNNSASIRIAIPGISRAYQAITITPKNGQYLTIPVNPISYGFRVNDLRSQGYSIFRPKGKNVLGISGPDNTFVALYALSTSVYQEQDPSLLPEDESVETAFIAGLEDYFGKVLPNRLDSNIKE